MASPLLTALLVAGATGALTAGVTVAVLSPSSRPAKQVLLADDGASNADLAGLRELVDELRRENDDLRERMVALEHAPMFMPQREPIGSPPAVALVDEDAQRELEALVATLRDPKQPPPPNFEATVAAALTNIREREDADREREREEQRAQRRDERLERLRVDLGLNDKQVNDMRDLMASVETRGSEAFRAARDSGDFQGVRESMRAMRDEADAQLQRILSPIQYDTYQESGGLMGGFGGPGGPGGGRGGRGGGGSGGGGTGQTGVGGGGGGRGGSF